MTTVTLVAVIVGVVLGGGSLGLQATITAGRIWTRQAIEEWATATGRVIVENGS
jgi:hypothetical protein